MDKIFVISDGKNSFINKLNFDTLFNSLVKIMDATARINITYDEQIERLGGKLPGRRWQAGDDAEFRQI